MLSDQSISLSNDLMFNIDLVKMLLQESEDKWQGDVSKIIQTVTDIQFKPDTWSYVEDIPTSGIFKNKVQRLFSCSAFNHELCAVATYRSSDDDIFEYVEYTSKSSIDRKKEFKNAMKQALNDQATKPV